MFYNPQKTAAFKEMLNLVVGQALAAAGYVCEDNTLQQARGLIRYHKPLGDEAYAFIEWQFLAFEQSPIAQFQVILLRNQGLDARAMTDYEQRAEHTLPWVIWHVFEARVVPSDMTWWEFRDGDELGQALVSAGRLLFGYGVPWLEMTL